VERRRHLQPGPRRDHACKHWSTAGHISNDGTLAISVSAAGPGSNPVAGEGQTGFAVGLRHSF